MSDTLSAVVAGTFALAGFFISNLVNGYNNREQLKIQHKNAIDQALINIRAQKLQEYWNILVDILDHGSEILTGSSNDYRPPREDAIDDIRKKRLQFRIETFKKLKILKIWIPPDMWPRTMEFYSFTGNIEFQTDPQNLDLLMERMEIMHHQLLVELHYLLVPLSDLTALDPKV